MIVESILAHSKNFVIGKGSGMPWHHRGDFKRFASITNGHALLMGAKTFFGITEHYKSKNAQILPGRTIFVLGSCKEAVDPDGHYHVHRRGYGPEWAKLTHQIVDHCKQLSIDPSNIRVVLDDDSAENIIRRIKPLLLEGQKLFISGGAKVYRDYMPLSSTIHVTVMDLEVQDEPGIVSLHEDSIDILNAHGHRILEGHEEFNGLRAFYHTLHLNRRDLKDVM